MFKFQILFFFIENDALPYWLGLTDVLTENTFIWTRDGSPMTYGRWANGEPNNQYSDEDCVHVLDYGGVLLWNDVPCSENYSVICEYRCSE